MNRPSCVIVGGGLAGITAALALARHDVDVTIVEQRPFLGGRAYSFRDPETGTTIDNGQHILVGACSRLQQLLSAIDAPARAFQRQRRLSATIVDTFGRPGRIEAQPLRPPFHLLKAGLLYPHLGIRERWAVASDLRALAALDPAARLDLEDVPFGRWLDDRGRSPAVTDRFWEPIVRPALNIPARDANIPMTALLVRELLWASGASGAMWVPRAGLSEAIGDPARGALLSAGVTLLCGQRVAAVEIADETIGGVVLTTGDAIDADAVIVAVRPSAADRIVPPVARPPDGFAAIGTSAIVNVYLWYDRPVVQHEVCGVLHPHLQWVFDRSRLLGSGAGEHCVGVSLSAADDLVDESKDAIATRCDTALADIFPERRPARLRHTVVVKEPRATFRAGVGANRHRPPAETTIRGLFLAGDWTDVGWPATMEGAVRSGESAARSVIASLAGRSSGAAIG